MSDVEDDDGYDDDLTTWPTERLKALEESLYDDEVAGYNVWFQRDQVLNELNRREWKDE